MDKIRKIVREKHGWDWGQNMPDSIPMEKAGQLNMFQPMCTGCAKDISI